MPNVLQPTRLTLVEIHEAWLRHFRTVNELAAYFGLSVKTACRCLIWGRERANRLPAQPPTFHADVVSYEDDLTVN